MSDLIQVIAIDGPSGAGKSTAAKRVAEALGWSYLDTGAMYRATSLAVHRGSLSLGDRAKMDELLGSIELGQKGTRIFLNGEDVSDAIRTPEVSKLVTPVSADARVREVLVAQQQKLGAQGGWVVDGRDIGTVVFPNAVTKIYLTASVAARASRRYRELESKGIATSLEEVKQDIERRDHADSTRAIAPLRKADDALEIDCSHLSIHEVIEAIVMAHKARTASA
jgi:cytidylate kinase